jgi:RNA polymerase primary sigma factor
MYATKAIVRVFARAVRRERGHRSRFITGHEQVLQAAANDARDNDDCENESGMEWKAVAVMIGRLNGRERQILTSRYGLDACSVQTLAHLGRVLGFTRERVRQIELQAHKKLRKLVFDELYGSTP